MQNSLRVTTLAHYQVTQRYFQRFLKSKYKLTDIALEKIDFKFLLDFEHFLRNWDPKDHQKPMNNNGVMKHMIRFRKLMKLANRLEWVEEKAFKNYRPKMEKVERKCLNPIELRKIEEIELKMERMQVVRDIFVFCCYTGLSYIDVYNLSEDHISFGIDGQQWLHFQRGKNKNPFSVPILQVTGGNGLFSGIGRVRIPFLNNIQVMVEFTNTQVNELNQIYAGELRKVVWVDGPWLKAPY